MCGIYLIDAQPGLLPRYKGNNHHWNLRASVLQKKHNLSSQCANNMLTLCYFGLIIRNTYIKINRKITNISYKICAKPTYISSILTNLCKKVVECWKSLLLSQISGRTKHNNREASSLWYIILGFIISKRFAPKTASLKGVPSWISWQTIRSRRHGQSMSCLQFKILLYFIFSQYSYFWWGLLLQLENLHAPSGDATKSLSSPKAIQFFGSIYAQKINAAEIQLSPKSNSSHFIMKLSINYNYTYCLQEEKLLQK